MTELQTRLQPLQALLAQTERERDAALAEHQRTLAACRAAEAQAEQLLTYRREYEQRWQRQFAHEGRIELVRCYHGFVERLTQAVTGQAQAARQAAGQVERAANLLREQEVRCASVRKLIDRRVRDCKVDIERREQRSSDELAARAAWARLNAERPEFS